MRYRDVVGCYILNQRKPLLVLIAITSSWGKANTSTWPPSTWLKGILAGDRIAYQYLKGNWKFQKDFI